MMNVIIVMVSLLMDFSSCIAVLLHKYSTTLTNLQHLTKQSVTSGFVLGKTGQDNFQVHL